MVQFLVKRFIGLQFKIIPMLEGDQAKRPATSPLQESLARLRRDTRAMVSLGVLLFIVLIALILPPIYRSSLGLMITDAQNNISQYPREILIPCIVLTIIVLCLSFLGDGLRDAFDPRSKD